LYKN